MHTLKLFFILLVFIGTTPVFPQINEYPTYPDYVAMMEEFHTKYPLICNIKEFGTSVQGRKLLAAVITDNIKMIEQEPQFFLTAALRGDELAGYMVSLRMIDYLLSNYGKNDQVTRLVDSTEIWINPLANPDGTYRGGDNTVDGATHKNANGVDLFFNFPIPNDSTTKPPQPETEALKELFAKEHFIMSADFIAGIECAVYPWGYTTGPAADDAWFKYVAGQYAKTAQDNSPDGYFEYAGTGVEKQSTFYSPPGTFLDYVLYFHHCRDIMIGISIQKMVLPTQLNNYWEYNYRSLLNLFEQVLNGVRGKVTAYSGGQPLEAKVFIENHDKDSSRVYSHLPLGNYYRPLFEGTYTITFSAENYVPETVKDVKVVNGQATIVNGKLNDPNSITGKNTGNEYISVKNSNGSVYITLNSDERMNCALFNLQGKLIREIPIPAVGKSRTVIWRGTDDNGNMVPEGCYVARFIHGGKVINKPFIFAK